MNTPKKEAVAETLGNKPHVLVVDDEEYITELVAMLPDLILDEDTRDVWRNGKIIELTPAEYKLIHYLLANAPRVLTRDQDPRNLFASLDELLTPVFLRCNARTPSSWSTSHRPPTKKEHS